MLLTDDAAGLLFEKAVCKTDKGPHLFWGRHGVAPGVRGVQEQVRQGMTVSLAVLKCLGLPFAGQFLHVNALIRQDGFVVEAV